MPNSLAEALLLPLQQKICVNPGFGSITDGFYTFDFYSFTLPSLWSPGVFNLGFKDP
jgi:hypothetical protein